MQAENAPRTSRTIRTNVQNVQVSEGAGHLGHSGHPYRGVSVLSGSDVPAAPLLGIDPGISGAWALLWPDGTTAAGDLPTAAGDVDAAGFATFIRSALPFAAVVEAVHSMPKQGVASTFRFGRAHGAVLGVLAALLVPTHLVAPTSWKRHFRLGSDKDASRALARRLWPACGVLERKKDHGRAEALLMARYGLERLDLDFDRHFMPEPATTAPEGC